MQGDETIANAANSMAKEIHQSYTQLDNTWNKVEAYLHSFKVPWETWIACDPSPEGGTFCMGFFKVRYNGRTGWRIVVGTLNDGEDEPGNWTPVVASSVVTRIKAAEHIEKLSDAIKERQKEVIPAVRGASQQLADFLAKARHQIVMESEER